MLKNVTNSLKFNDIKKFKIIFLEFYEFLNIINKQFLKLLLFVTMNLFIYKLRITGKCLKHLIRTLITSKETIQPLSTALNFISIRLEFIFELQCDFAVSEISLIKDTKFRRVVTSKFMNINYCLNFNKNNHLFVIRGKQSLYYCTYFLFTDYVVLIVILLVSLNR